MHGALLFMLELLITWFADYISNAISQMTGKALEDSIRIVTKFSEMENTYSSLNSLRFVKVLTSSNFTLACHVMELMNLVAIR